MYSTVLGGSANDSASDLALDAAGDAYVVGSTQSADFPATGGAGTGFAAKLAPSGARDYATRLNGTLRAVAPAADGSATPPVTPPAPAPIAPALGTPADASIATGPVTFDWSDVAGAASYEIQIDEVDAFRLPLVESAQPTASQYTTGTLPAGTWFWHVRAINSEGTSGAWSDTRTITVAAPVATVTPTPSGPLPAPSLLGPSADARFSPGQPITFDWIQVDGATSYTIQIDDSDKFSSPLVAEQTLTGSSYTTSTLPTTKLWWRVRANDGGAWSAVRRFEVK